MNLILKFINQAEAAGLLAIGCAELFKKAHVLKRELKMDICSLQTTIGDLYCRQIALNKTVEGILRCQKVQQRLAVVNAILASIPLAGGVAGHGLSGGMAILENVDGEDFALSGLVESLLGIGNDWSSVITEPALKCFLHAVNIVLEEETWKAIPKVNRLSVEAAVQRLGILMDELRARLQSSVLGEPCISTSTSFEVIGEISDAPEGDKESISISNCSGIGNFGTISVDVTSESVAPQDEEVANRNGGQSSTAGEKDGDSRLSLMEIYKKMEMMELQAEEQEETIKKMKKHAGQQQETINKMVNLSS